MRENALQLVLPEAARAREIEAPETCRGFDQRQAWPHRFRRGEGWRPPLEHRRCVSQETRASSQRDGEVGRGRLAPCLHSPSTPSRERSTRSFVVLVAYRAGPYPCPRLDTAVHGGASRPRRQPHYIFTALDPPRWLHASLGGNPHAWAIQNLARRSRRARLERLHARAYAARRPGRLHPDCLLGQALTASGPHPDRGRRS